MTVYLVWPVLAGMALAGVLAISVGGVVLIASGTWRAAAVAAAVTFFVVLALATVAVFWYAARSWAGPGELARLHQTKQIVEQKPPDPEIRFIPMGGRPPALNAPAPGLPSGVNRGIVRKLLGSWRTV